MHISSHLLSVSLETTGGLNSLEQSSSWNPWEHLVRAPHYLACVPEAGIFDVIESFYICVMC